MRIEIVSDTILPVVFHRQTAVRRGAQRTPNTVASHRLIHFSSLPGRQDAVVEGEYAVSGAQSVEVFQQIFDLVREQDANTPAAAE